MDGLRFASPYVLLLLPAIALAALWLARRRAGGGAVALGSIEPALPARRTWRLRLLPLLPALRLVAAALLVVALARPQKGEAGSEAALEGVDIVLAFDVSSSMSQPFARGRPRLEVAKDVLSQFVSSRRDDRVGLVIFKGRSLTMSPLTTDYEAVDEAVRGADAVKLEDGTAIGIAMAESVNVLRGSSAASRIVILLTDGENNVHEIEPLAAARIAERLGVRVYTIGVVSRPPAGTRSTLNVDEEALRRIAEITGGTYNRAEDPAALAETYASIDALEKSRLQGREFTRFDELAPYALAAAAAALALELALAATLLRRAA